MIRTIRLKNVLYMYWGPTLVCLTQQKIQALLLHLRYTIRMSDAMDVCLFQYSIVLVCV